MKTRICAHPNCPRPVAKDMAICRTHHHYKQQKRARAEGWPSMKMVPVSEILPHMDQLRENGLGYAQIARESGIAARHLREIRRRLHVHPSTAAKILNVPITFHDLQADGATVPHTGSTRRLRALQRMGYTNYMLRDETGLCLDVVTRILHARENVNASTARIVHATFNRLQLVDPPQTHAAKRARMRAERRGWALPLAWDEDTIDDPNAEPIVTEADKFGWYFDYLELKSLGKTHDQIAERFGITTDALKVRLRRHHARATGSNQEHEQIRQGDEQMVREDRERVAAL